MHEFISRSVPALILLALSTPDAAAQMSYQEDFEALSTGSLAGQGGWSAPTGGAATILDTGMSAFGNRSLSYDPPAQNLFSFTERLRSPDLGNGSGTLSFDCVVSGGSSVFDLTLYDSSSSLYFLHVRLDPTGLITVRQPAGAGLLNFTATSGTWTPNVPMRIGLELYNNENSIRVYKDGNQIFSGSSIGASSTTATGMDAFVVLQSTGSSGSSTITIDNFDYVPCTDAVPYCAVAPNSTGLAAQLSVFGSTSIASNDLSYFVSRATPSSFGFLYYGLNQTQVPFGDGFRCVGGGGLGIFRLAPVQQLSAANLPFSAGGSVSAPLDLSSGPFASGPGMVTPGATWNFQFVYRDSAPGGGATFNTTNALSITFCP